MRATSHLRPLADDVAPEPDPRSAGELEAEAGRFGDGGRRGRRSSPGGSRATSSVSDRRASAASRREPVGDLRGGRAGVRARRQVDDEQVDRPAGEERAGDRQALVERVRRQDDEPVEADAAGDGLDRVEGAGEVEPGDDRAVGLGLRGEPEGEGRLAGAGVAAEGDAGAPRQAAGAEDRVERREAGPDDPLDAVRGAVAGAARSGSSSGSGAVASAPTTRGAAAPQRAWRDARAADTSGESAAIGRL